LDRIIGQAREIVRSEGAAALTMRTLASRLQTSPTVLYRAVQDRADLLDRVVDATLDEIDIEFDPESNAWLDECRSAAMTMFRVLCKNDGVAPLMIERVPTGPRSIVLRENLLSMLLGHGLSPEDASRVYATMVRTVVGFAAQRVGSPEAAARESERLSAAYQNFDASQLPATVAVAQILPFQTIEEEFEFGLDLMLSGLERYVNRQD
jgi:AcrR family transcriptional regulator